MASTDAVRVMSLEESEEVRRQLKECNRKNRILPNCETVETFRATWRPLRESQDGALEEGAGARLPAVSYGSLSFQACGG